MKYAIIENTLVVNIVVADAEFAQAQGWIDATWASIGDTWDGAEFIKPAPPPVDFGKEQSAFILKIDADADAIYAKALGNRETEYAQADSDAKAYKAAGYTGTVPAYVQAWATATGKSATWATDDILATSTAWRTAMAAIRFNRLGRKEDARKAVDMAALEVVKAQWAGFVTAITTQLGV